MLRGLWDVVPRIEPGPSAVRAQSPKTGHGSSIFLRGSRGHTYELSLSHFTLSVEVFHSFFPVLKRAALSPHKTDLLSV